MLSLLGHNTKELCPIFVFLHFIIQQNDKHCDHNATFSQWGLKIEGRVKLEVLAKRLSKVDIAVTSGRRWGVDWETKNRQCIGEVSDHRNCLAFYMSGIYFLCIYHTWPAEMSCVLKGNCCKLHICTRQRSVGYLINPFMLDLLLMF